MKRKSIAVIALGLTLVAGTLLGCQSKAAGDSDTTTASEDKVIKVGASVTPHAEILAQIKDALKEKGYTLEIVEYNDYVLPNTALEDGDLDANYFQHQPYLDSFNEENGTHLVSVAAIHFEPFGLYAGKTDSLKDLKDGAIVAVPNDTSNEARALLLLEAQGLITLKEDAGVNATILDIEENPLNLEFKEIEAAQLTKSLPDVDIAAINGNYAISGGLSVSDALAVEATDSLAAETYANIIVVKEGNEETDKTKALIEALQTDAVKQYIEDTYKGAVVPVF